MMTRNGAKIGGGVVAIVATIASCSFPTYDITVTGGSDGATTAASGSSGSGGASTSSGSGGGAGGATASSGASTSSSASSTTTSTSSGPCTTDEDGDGVISWQCAGGKDCADQDKRAHPGADFTPGAAILGLRSPGTLPYDFNCDFSETKQTLTLSCTGAVCPTPVTTQGFAMDVSCGASGNLGHCAGTLPCGFVSDSANTTEVCK